MCNYVCNVITCTLILVHAQGIQRHLDEYHALFCKFEGLISYFHKVHILYQADQWFLVAAAEFRCQ